MTEHKLEEILILVKKHTRPSIQAVHTQKFELPLEAMNAVMDYGTSILGSSMQMLELFQNR